MIQIWFKKIKSALSWLSHKITIKKARITYQVIWNLFLLFLIVVILSGSFAAGVGAGYFASLVHDEPIRSYESMKKDIYNYTETSDLYFADNVYLGKLRSDLEREEVKLNQVSDHLIHAIVATEDEYFYQHNGVVPKSIFRAVVQEVTNSSVQTGGSTLTQQLIKNQILSNEVSFQRKANEILLALRLEKFFTKKQILEAYLNVTTFGRNASGRNIAGVQAAAKGLFGKNAKDITLPEAAFIAGLPQSPFGYTPFTRDGKLKNNLHPGISRMKTVLKRMHDSGYINEKQYTEAAAYDITKDFTQPKDNPIEKYPWLTFEIEKRSIQTLATVLAQKDGISEKTLKEDKYLHNKYLTLADRDLRQKGYEIHTTIDKNIYDAMQQAKDQYKSYGPDKPQSIKDPETGENKAIMEPVEVGAMLIENKTGRIISFVGGRDYNRQQLNHATSSIRQNGSTMKPLLVYAPAFELGKASPGSVLPDVALKLNPSSPNSPWPHNYDKRYTGLVSARYALTKSYNVPAVKLYKDIVDQSPAKYLEKMGFTSLVKDDYTNLAAAIGSIKNGVTVEENTNAFTTFANGGKFIDAYLIDKIVDKQGNVVYQHKGKPVDVFSPQTAFLTLDMMRDVVKKGTAAGINSKLNFQTDWAGKTGTGTDFIDSWFVATNPNVTFGIWTGYDTPKSLQAPGNLTYSQRNNNLWAALINSAYAVKPDLIAPKEQFKMPEGIIKQSICAVSGLLPSEACSSAGLVESDYFNAKFVPTKVDDSLINGKYVEIGDKKYLANNSTPDDFAHKGLILNPDFIKKLVGANFTDYNQLIPKLPRWDKVLVPSAELKENGKPPASVSLSLSGTTLTWSQAAESDVIGYRVYRIGVTPEKVASIKTGTALSFTVSDGAYYVTTVDISGNESAPSNVVQFGIAP
ncbi:transglycosylase domain-containing protein [Bacillota bacterium Lsc_1132]